MGVGDEGLSTKAHEIEGIADYKKLFDVAFPGDGVTPETIVMAIAAYMRTLVCSDTAFDKFAAGDKSALTEQQQKGSTLHGQGRAASPATLRRSSRPRWTSEQGTYFNTGIGVAGTEGSGSRRRPHEGHGRTPPTGRPSSRRACAT